MLNRIRGRGWLPDYPDCRDYTCNTDIIRQMYERRGVSDIARVPELPECIDLREQCSPIEDQGEFGSCTAHAAVGIVEFYIKRAHGTDFKASPFFLYKVTRNLIGFEEDKGAFLRDTMKAMVLFGVPPESYCIPEGIDDEPSAFCYALAQNYQAERYHRLDAFDVSPKDLLHCIKVNLSLGLPPMFGFTTYASIEDEKVRETGKIPYPSNGEKVDGGHAVVAVGYNDKCKIKNCRNGEPTVGALLIRNSWGKEWGEDGYGWLPYRYVLEGQTSDWWILAKNEWVDTEQFDV